MIWRLGNVLKETMTIVVTSLIRSVAKKNVLNPQNAKVNLKDLRLLEMALVAGSMLVSVSHLCVL